jgi:hypothetical protein
MEHGILDGTNIDTSVFTFSAPKPHESGGKVVNLMNKHTKESIEIATPLILTWGAQEGLDTQKKPTGKFTMSLQFPTKEYSNADLEAFLANMKKVEAAVKDAALTNSKEWFGKAITNPELVNDRMNDMLKHPKIKGTEEKDESKPPTLTVKLPCWKGSWRSEVFDEDGEPLFVPGKVNQHQSPVEYIARQTQVACVIQCGGIWFTNGKFSIVWNLKQAVVQKPKAKIEGKCLINLKSSDKEALKKQVAEPEIHDDGVSIEVADSGDEAEPEVPATVFKAPEPAPAPTPAPVAAAEEKKVVKKVVKKKTDA